MKIFLPFVLLVAPPTSLLAHDFYILPANFIVAPNARIEVRLQNGDSFPESESAPVLARVKDAELRTSGVRESIASLTVVGNRAVGFVVAPSSPGLVFLAARTTPNFIQLEPDKALDYFKEEGLDDVINWRIGHGEAKKPSRERYSKFAKSLLWSGASDNSYKEVIGFPIEIIPEADPYRLHQGDLLPVKVTFRGKPAVGLQMEAASAGDRRHTSIIGRTDSEGRIRVPIDAVGQWRLHTLKMERCADAAIADWESFWASLTFEIR